MAQYDGSITLETRVDTKGIKNAEKSIKSATKNVGDEFGKVGEIFAKALSEGDTKTAQLANNYQKAVADVEKYSLKAANLKVQLSQLESGEKVPTNKGVVKLQGELDSVTLSIQKTKNEINQLYLQLDNLQANAFKAPNTGNIVFTESEQSEYDKINAKLNELEPKLESNKQKAKELGLALREAAGNATQTEIDKVKSKLSDTETKLKCLQAKAEITGQKLNNSFNSAKNESSAVGSSIEKAGNKLLSLAKGALVFSAITKGFTMLREGLGKALMSNEGFRQSLNELQAAFWVAFTPIYNYVLPAIKTLIRWITSALVIVGKFISMLTGKSYSAMVEDGKTLQQQADGYEAVSNGSNKAAKGIKKATNEAKKQLAAFDELNILSEEKSNSDGDAGGYGDNVGVESSTGFEALGNITSEVTDVLSQIMAIAGGFMLALGIILVCAGMYGVGIPLMAIGALTLASAVAINWNTTNEQLNSVLTIITTAVGGFALAIGAMLTFTGASIGLGIALMALGAVSLASAVALNWGSPDGLNSAINTVTGIVGGALLGLGALLAFSGANIPLGIALMAIGALTLASAVAINWAGLPDETKKTIELITGIVGGALLVLGIILTCTGANIPLGLALIAAGAVSLASVIVPNWNYITDKTKEFFQTNAGLIVGVSLALIVLGIILLFTGVGIPLALGLIVAGGGALAGTIAANWDFIVDKVKEVWGNIKAFWQQNIAPWFTKEKWIELVGKIGTGLQNGFKSAINGVISIVEKGVNWIINKINSLSWDVPDWVPGIGGKKWGFDFNEIKIPRLAQGAVIPPNREFLAVLGDQKQGTNIEAPLSTIEQAVENVLSRTGYSNANQPIILQLNGREVGRSFGNVINRESIRKGPSFINSKTVIT